MRLTATSQGPRSPRAGAPWRAGTLALSLATTLASCSLTPTAPGDGPQLHIARDDAAGTLTVRAGAHDLITWQAGSQKGDSPNGSPQFAIPHWFPVKSPSGKNLLAQHPDPYPHHRALWIADKVQLGAGPIVDFYHCVPNQIDPRDASKGWKHFLRQLEPPRCDVRGNSCTATARLQWLANGSQPVLDDERTWVVTALGDAVRGHEMLLDLSWTLTANHGDVTFHSDWVHYAWPYLRMHPQFSVERGAILVDDVGRRGQQGTNAQYANWIDYSNTVDGVTEGLAVFVPQDGHWRKWLTRDYGTFGPRRPDAQSGTKFTLAKGQSLTGKVRIYVHRGDAVTGRVAERYRDYVRSVR